jgi:hypothetical protein
VPAAWLQPLVSALDGADGGVDVWFRDDDAGWRDERLLELLDRFAERGLPLDVAAIPSAVGEELTGELRARHAAASGRLGLHQHGFAHTNHETEGKKQEFGPARSADEQRRDLREGRERLRDLLGDALDPVFTPPWNRCTEVTGRCLLELGVRVLSREARVPPLALPGLAEVPVHVDWFAKRKGERLGRDEIGAQLAAAVRSGGPVGVMFHHAEMDADEMAAAGELLDVLAGHPAVRPRRVLDLAPAA